MDEQQENRADDNRPILTAEELLSPISQITLDMRRSPSRSFRQEESEDSVNSTIENDNSWQATKTTVCERNSVMFNNELMSDVSFLVGPKGSALRIPAHKYILATGSSVFFAMLYGDMAENKNEIEIPDVEPVAFRILLKYLYCDKISLEADTVLATLYAAKKYIIPYLARACVRFLETSLSAKNACILLSQSWLFEEKELTQRCWEVIDAQAELALQSEVFTEIDLRTLNSILERETLNVKETVIFDAILRWSEAECKRSDLETTLENRRNALGNALNLLRLPAMTLQEFADGPARSGLLTQQEIIDIFFWFASSRKPKLEFPTSARSGLTPQVCRRFLSCAYRSNQWRYRGRCDSIQFMAEKRIFLAGFGLYGSSSGAAKYTADTKLTRGQDTLAEEKISFLTDGCTKIFPVWFRHPVQCEANVFYTASVVLDGNELSYFGQEGMSEVTCGGVVIQFQCSNESTNGTGVQGGQIPELIFYRGAS
uniref:BTB/POZ domain-containing protein 3-like n=1 Tax=Styela clava TaxID=7725 RepID=UPI00193A895A|nr:BTB/POZ domain-containing protein 3-like [Styela clava]